jgi:hypothetical protein
MTIRTPGIFLLRAFDQGTIAGFIIINGALVIGSKFLFQFHHPIAILSSDKSGWGDLLMARLSNNPKISLVERDVLGKALDEVELKELLGDRKKRSHFGEIAGADFLVLMSIADNRARLVVCDTHLGVTLQDQSITTAEQYIRYNFRPYEPSAWPKGAKADANNPLWLAASEQTISNWKRSLHHCEYLVLNRRISREEATDLSKAAIFSITGAGGRGPLGDCEAQKKTSCVMFFRE